LLSFPEDVSTACFQNNTLHSKLDNEPIKKKKGHHVSTFSGFYGKDMSAILDYIGHATTYTQTVQFEK